MRFTLLIVLCRQKTLGLRPTALVDAFQPSYSFSKWNQYPYRTLYSRTRQMDTCISKSCRCSSYSIYKKADILKYQNQTVTSTIKTQYRGYSHHQSYRSASNKWWGLIGGVVIGAGAIFKLTTNSLKAKEDAKENRPASDIIAADTDEVADISENITMSDAICISRDIVQRIKDETGSPGLVVSVSVDGHTVWSEGLGYSDVENRVPCSAETVFRIASISKSITMATVAKLVETGDLDLDKPIQHYVPSFPEKTFDGEKVNITTRQLVSHFGGIRHYEKKYMNQSDKNNNSTKKSDKQPSGSAVKTDKKENQSDKQPSGSAVKTDKKENQSSQSESAVNEMELAEYFITKHYNSLEESLSLFKDDPLVHKPGTKFLYTTHGWTLISAVVEGVTKTPFDKHLKSVLKDLGMAHTYLDENEPLIYHRGKHYMKNKKGRLINTPYVDLSYKWAGGGLISNVLDVTKFGNIMLYSYQATSNHGDQGEKGHKLDKSNKTSQNSNLNIPGYLKPETMKMIFMPIDDALRKTTGYYYGMGWFISKKKHDFGCCRQQRFFTSHTGAAIGASSVLLILPRETEELDSKGSNSNGLKSDRVVLPKGVVVAIIVNMTSVELTPSALSIAETFERVKKR